MSGLRPSNLSESGSGIIVRARWGSTHSVDRRRGQEGDDLRQTRRAYGPPDRWRDDLDAWHSAARRPSGPRFQDRRSAISLENQRSEEGFEVRRTGICTSSSTFGLRSQGICRPYGTEERVAWDFGFYRYVGPTALKSARVHRKPWPKPPTRERRSVEIRGEKQRYLRSGCERIRDRHRGGIQLAE
jgi:hypothetical protein